MVAPSSTHSANVGTTRFIPSSHRCFAPKRRCFSDSLASVRTVRIFPPLPRGHGRKDIPMFDDLAVIDAKQIVVGRRATFRIGLDQSEDEIPVGDIAPGI